jgi:hypothetical protein
VGETYGWSKDIGGRNVLSAKEASVWKKGAEIFGIFDIEEWDPAKIEAVKNIAAPKNKTDLLTFLGMTGHYRRFVRQYADVAAPCTN